MIEDSLERAARWIEEEKERRALQLKVNEQKEDELKAIRDFHDLPLSKNINKLYLWTEKGAFLQAKSLNPQKAWGVYENLVKDFFARQFDVHKRYKC